MKEGIVQNIAYKLFLTNIDALEYELEEKELSLFLNVKSDDYYLNDNKLIFSSLDDRDKYVAYYYFSEISTNCGSKEDIISLTAFNIWEKTLRGESTVAGLFLCLYENDIDIWKLLLATERNAHDITSLADQYIKHTKNIDTQKLFFFFSAVYNKKNQYLGMYLSLEEKLSDNPQKCHEIINNIHTNIKPDTLQLYNIALSSLKKQYYKTTIDILLCDIQRNDSILSPQSLWILGRIVEKSKSRYRNSDIVKVIKNSILSPIPVIFNAAVQAAVDTVVQFSEICSVIRNLLESNNIKLMEVLSFKLYFTKQLVSHSDFPFWLSYLCKAAIENDSLCDSILHTLSYLAKDESKHELLIDCLFIILRNNSISEKNKKIENLVFSIAKHPNLLNRAFTLSLIDENLELTVFSRIVATYLVVHNNEHILEFCVKTITNFTKNEFIFLVRRLLGFISNETQLTSLTLSLLKVKKSKNIVYSLVKEVIINEIAMDYPNYVSEEIKKRKNHTQDQENKILKLYNEILFEVDNNQSSFTILPRIKELSPPSLLIHNFQKERDKVMSKSNNLHKEESFIFKIANQIILKAGVGSFYYDDINNKGYSEPSYLHNFSSSYSLPRRYVMDNIGYDIMIAQFRSAKKDME